MSKVQKRRAAAAKKTIHPPEKEEEQHGLPDGVIEPEVPVHRAEFQQLLMIKEEVKWSSSLDQDDPPELPHIKEEQEELWTRQEGAQLQGLEEADINFTFSPVPVKSEEDGEEKPQYSQLHQIKPQEIKDLEHSKSEATGEDYGGPEPTRNFDPESHSQPASLNETSHSSEPETDDNSSEPETDNSSESETDDSCDCEVDQSTSVMFKLSAK
ncbi:uncharacterized protein LOC115578264 isoform X2 [Sparus aurata]|uniref:uncharacterized protein LOC115578264 isoform X2 n=1 Tax=Sparus aurata TaxID=8175 RepID=UPI0011C1694C|nr:uncharacterized protein LOC115578264 isoform X2 [Sparus aurata]